MMSHSDSTHTEFPLEAILEGMQRVAHIADRSKNHEYVMGGSKRWPELVPLMDRSSGLIPQEAAIAHLDQWMARARYRSYLIQSSESSRLLYGYAYTTNNSRELQFLQRLLDAANVQRRVTNLCDQEYRIRTGISRVDREEFLEAFRIFLGSHPDVRPSMVSQLGKYATSIQSARETLGNEHLDTFVVANDHSPAPVAFAMVARQIGARLVYVQHAEVSAIFPPLYFDLSILRNQRSRSVYEEIAPVDGKILVVARGNGPWTRPKSLHRSRRRLSRMNTNRVVVYPSSVLEIDRLKELVQNLAGNPHVEGVGVKLHPNTRYAIDAEDLQPAELTSTIPQFGHIAICGNSSIVVELLERGSLVFQDFSLDRVASDYYSFAHDGLVGRLPPTHASSAFWRDYSRESRLPTQMIADWMPRLDTWRNRRSARCVVPMLRDFFENDVFESA